VARLKLPLLVALAGFLLAEAGYRFQALGALEDIYSDLWHRVAGVRYSPERTALVVLDDASLAQYPDVPLAFWTPLLARAAATLRAAGVAVIGLDFNYQVTAENWIRKEAPNIPALKDYDLAFRQELNGGKLVLVAAAARGTPGERDTLILPPADHLLALPDMDVVANVALADLVVDRDGAVRHYELAPQLNLAPDIASGAPRDSLAALLARRAGGAVPRSGSGTISYAGPPGTIPRVPIARVLAQDSLKDPVVAGLKGKAVIIGGDYLGMNDVHSTPYSSGFFGRVGPLMTGPEIQAHTVETLLSAKATAPTADVWRWLAFAIVLGLAIAAYRFLSPWAGLAALAAGCAVALAAGYAAFLAFSLFPAAHLQLGLAAGYVLTYGQRLTREEREKARQRALFEGYVSESVIEMYLGSDRKIDLGGQAMRITVLFSDIRGFTTITEKLTAHEVVEFLNVYFSRAIEVIQAEGGRIDKFIGDAIMAEFGVPHPFPDHAARAARRRAHARRRRRVQGLDAQSLWRPQHPGLRSRHRLAHRRRRGRQHRLQHADGVHRDRRHRERRFATGRRDEDPRLRYRSQRRDGFRRRADRKHRPSRIAQGQRPGRARGCLRNHRSCDAGGVMTRWIWMVGMLWSATGWADQAMLTQVSGQVSVEGKDGKRTGVAFLKVATGEKLSLGADARVQIVYFGNGRQEIWSGAGQVEVAGLEGKSTALKPEIKQLPPLVVNQLAKTPAAGQQGKAGMILVRSLENPDAVDHLDKQYDELKRATPAGDTTAEVFLLSGLIELKEFARAKELLATLRDKPEYKPVVDHFSPLVTR
jgi:adenylate cyclase